MRADRQLILEDGSTFPGMGFGSRKDAVYGIVFNTSCVGCQEILSDPSYGVLEKAGSRITNEVAGISRVVYDITSKPPATVEWE